MKSTYKKWLEQQRYSDVTVNAQIYRARKVEECYGDLDRHYQDDGLQSVISELKYSKENERQNKPNSSKIRFKGNIRNNLASYRNAIERYRKFRDKTPGEESNGGNSEVENEEINNTGFIDITAKDAEGKIVVIELKTGTARQKAVAQILSYMGDITEEEEDTATRGILVAADFDTKAQAAARVVPTLLLRSYRVNFEFTDADETPGSSRKERVS